MDWILVCKLCKFGKYICYNVRDIKFFLGGYFFGAPCTDGRIDDFLTTIPQYGYSCGNNVSLIRGHLGAKKHRGTSTMDLLTDCFLSVYYNYTTFFTCNLNWKCRLKNVTYTKRPKWYGQLWRQKPLYFTYFLTNSLDYVRIGEAISSFRWSCP